MPWERRPRVVTSTQGMAGEGGPRALGWLRHTKGHREAAAACLQLRPAPRVGLLHPCARSMLVFASGPVL